MYKILSMSVYASEDSQDVGLGVIDRYTSLEDIAFVLADELGYVPDLFDDTYVKDHIERTGGAIQQLVQHIMSDDTEYAPAEGRRIFEENRNW